MINIIKILLNKMTHQTSVAKDIGIWKLGNLEPAQATKLLKISKHANQN